MFDPNSPGDYLTGLSIGDGAALIFAALALFALAYLGLHALTRRSRARARAAAAEWARMKGVEWEARAKVRADARTERATPAARARRSRARARALRFGLVALVAVAATRLSAHAVQGNLNSVADAWDIRAAVFVCLEGALALCAGLSYWHRTSGRSGFDQYNAAVWILSGLMAAIAWHGGGDLGWFFAPFPLMAAIAWHWLVTFEAREAGHHRRGVASRAWAKGAAAADRIRVRLGGTATSADTNRTDRERRISRIETCAYKANLATWATRAYWTRAFHRAMAAAHQRGVLDEAARAELRARMAARYAGPGALAPAEVADANPWKAARADLNARADVQVDQDTAAGAEAPAPAPAAPVLRVVPDVDKAPAAAADPAAIMATYFTADSSEALEAYEWALKYFHENGKWPTGKALGAAVGVHEATGRTWMKPVRDAWAKAVAS